MSNDSNQTTTIITDDMISAAMMAIESTDPSPKEREDMLLTKLIPSIREALDRGDSEEKIRRRLKSAIPGLHYSKIKKLCEAAKSFDSEQDQPEEDAR